jgi:Uma2 family endonuclease
MESRNPIGEVAELEKEVSMSAIPLGRPLKSREVEYPSSDGKPMAETDLHRDEMVYVIEALQEHFLDVPDIYVSGNLLLYYVEGDPRYCVSPDALVAKGLAHAKSQRDTYKVWEEGRVPCWVMEVTSRSTRREDLRKKKDLYRQLGVDEYFLFDPREEYLVPSLQGFRLVNGPGGAAGEYWPVPPEEDGSLVSPALGILFRREGQGLRLLDARTGEPCLRARENVELRRQSEDRAKREALRAEREAERAEREAAARQEAETRAAQEAQARQALEAEIAELRRQLKGGAAG